MSDRIETARLLLRPFTAADAPAWLAIRTQPAVARFLPPLGDDPARYAGEIAAAFASHWAERGYGPYAVIDKPSGRLLGHHGLRVIPEFGETEALWSLDPTVHGRGLATEAGRAVLAHAFDRVRLPRLIAVTTEDNGPSRRVMAKLGFRFEKAATFKGYAVLYHGLDAAEYQSRR